MTTSAETSPPSGREAGVPAQRDQRSQLRRALVSMALPVFFAIGFSLCFISASHAPVPRMGQPRNGAVLARDQRK